MRDSDAVRLIGVRRLIVGLAAAAISSAAAAPLRAAPGDTSADAALGRPDLFETSGTAPPRPPTPITLLLSNAAHVAVAPNGRIWVSDASNNRVLSWPSAATFSTGQPADFVLGQPNLFSNTPNNGGVSPHAFSLPQGLWVDAAGNLWVTDAFNHRVLKFNNPMTDATPTDADLVVGQVDLFSNQENLGQGGSGPSVALPDSLQFPGRVVVVGSHLWIADSGNSRVLHYPLPTANKPFADRVFGQYGDFTKRAKNNDGMGENFGPPTSRNLYNPIGIAVDSVGRLYIADWANNRILRYDDPVTSDDVADVVFGQPDFTSADVDNGGLLVGLQRPIDIAFDGPGRLFIVDAGNNRVLVHADPLINVEPDAVFGQLNSFTDELLNHGLGDSATDPDGLAGPTGVTTDDAGNVYVVDTNNHRVLRFDTPLTLRGDVNCDGVINSQDAVALSLLLTNPSGFAATYPGCDPARGDVNDDGLRNGVDVQAFVAVLLGP